MHWNKPDHVNIGIVIVPQGVESMSNLIRNKVHTSLSGHLESIHGYR